MPKRVTLVLRFVPCFMSLMALFFQGLCCVSDGEALVVLLPQVFLLYFISLLLFGRQTFLPLDVYSWDRGEGKCELYEQFQPAK